MIIYLTHNTNLLHNYKPYLRNPKNNLYYNNLNILNLADICFDSRYLNRNHLVSYPEKVDPIESSSMIFEALSNVRKLQNSNQAYQYIHSNFLVKFCYSIINTIFFMSIYTKIYPIFIRTNIFLLFIKKIRD